MVTVEKTSGGLYHSRSVGLLTVGDRVDVSDDLAVYLCDDRDDFERVIDETGEKEEDASPLSLTDLDGVGESTAETLRDAGFTAHNVGSASVDDLVTVDGVGEALAADLSNMEE